MAAPRDGLRAPGQRHVVRGAARLRSGCGDAPRSFHGDHYDVPQERYGDLLVSAGAVPVTGAELVRLLTASGLRLRKRRGDRPVGRVPAMVFPDGTMPTSTSSPRRGPWRSRGSSRPWCFVQDARGVSRSSTARGGVMGVAGRLAGAGRAAAEAAVREVAGGDRDRAAGRGRCRRAGTSGSGRRQAGRRAVASGPKLPAGATGPDSRGARRRWPGQWTTSTGGTGWTVVSSSGCAAASSGGRWCRGCSTSCRRRGLASSPWR